MIQTVIENRAWEGRRRQARACRDPNPPTAQRHKGWLALVCACSSFCRWPAPSRHDTAIRRRPARSAGGPCRRAATGAAWSATPNPVDNTSNLVITGNVSGGKAFRGNIPYGSTTSFGGRLGSTSLDPFLRYSAVPEEPSEGPSASTPLLFADGDRPEDSAGLLAACLRRAARRWPAVVMQSQAEQPADIMPASDTLQPQALRRTVGGIVRPKVLAMVFGRRLAAPKRRWKGLPRCGPGRPRRCGGSWPASPAVPRPSGAPPQSKQIMTSEEYQRQLEQLQRDLDRVKTNASQFEQNLKTGRQPSVQPMEQKPAEAVQPLYSAEALRRIIQPQSQPQRPSAPMNPPPARTCCPTGDPGS